MTLVAGVDSSTQACKVVVRDAATGALVRSGTAKHPDGTEVDPSAWWAALREAIAGAGGIDDVAAISVAAQQHGMVCLDEDGRVVRPALLWNDTRSAAEASALVDEFGGARAWAEATGSVPLASFTVTKLRWMAAHEPAAMARTAAVCLPHDWLTWKLTGARSLDTLVTDRSDASGTGYWSPSANAYRPDLIRLACGRDLIVPTVLSGAAVGGELPGAAPAGPSGGAAPGDIRAATGTIAGAGAGDNAAAALGVGARPDDVVVSIGTSGTAFRRWSGPSADQTGAVAGFADAQDGFLPLVCTLNAARVLDAAARMLGATHDQLAALAATVPTGADGLVLVPYLEGERTPNKPDATGALHGLTLANTTPAHLARAAVEGMLCALADGVDALGAVTAPARRVILIGGGAASAAVRAIAPAIFGVPVLVPAPSQYVADGAARQAAWAYSATAEPPEWPLADPATYTANPAPFVRARYADAAALTLTR